MVTNYANLYLVPISFRSRSDLVLDADHALDFVSYLVLQACISFCSVSDQTGAALFFLVRIEMLLLIWKIDTRWGQGSNRGPDTSVL